MAKYRKKPVVVEAEVYRPGMEDGFAIDDECKQKFGDDLDSCSRQELMGCKGCRCFKPYINTLEGKHYISPGDYIITGIKGERYPVCRGIFEKTYEPVLKDESIEAIEALQQENEQLKADLRGKDNEINDLKALVKYLRKFKPKRNEAVRKESV